MILLTASVGDENSFFDDCFGNSKRTAWMTSTKVMMMKATMTMICLPREPPGPSPTHSSSLLLQKKKVEDDSNAKPPIMHKQCNIVRRMYVAGVTNSINGYVNPAAYKTDLVSKG